MPRRKKVAEVKNEFKVSDEHKHDSKVVGFVQAKRRAEVAKLYIRGWTMPDIAEKLDVNTGLVSGDIKALLKMWREVAITDFDEKKALELEKLRMVEHEAMLAWERSCKNGEVLTERTEHVRRAVLSKKTGKPTGKYELIPTKVIQEKTVKGAVGDPRFLDIYRECVLVRLRIMGLLTTDKPTQQQIVQINWAGMYAPNSPVQAGSSGQIGYLDGSPNATVIDGGKAIVPGTGPQDPIEEKIAALEKQIVPREEQVTDRPAVLSEHLTNIPTTRP